MVDLSVLDEMIALATPLERVGAAGSKPRAKRASTPVAGWDEIAKVNQRRFSQRRRALTGPCVRKAIMDPVMAYLERLYDDEYCKMSTAPTRVLATRRCVLCGIPGTLAASGLCERCSDRTMFDCCGCCSWSPFASRDGRRIVRLRKPDGLYSRICPNCGEEDWWTRKLVLGTQSRAEASALADVLVLEERGYDSATPELLARLAKVRSEHDKLNTKKNKEALLDRQVFARVYTEAFKSRMPIITKQEVE